MRRFPLLFWLFLAGCAAMDPFKHAPPSATSPYEDGRGARLAEKVEAQADQGTTLLPEKGKALSLPELINLAQSNNRATRLAWQQARAAAIATGLASADYFPLLAVAASYGGGYMDFTISGRENLSGISGVTSLVPAAASGLGVAGAGTVLHPGIGDSYTNFLSGAGLRWLLFDFGARQHRNRAAVSDQLAANLRFNAAHQKVAFSVTENYYQLQAALRQTEASRIAQQSAAQVLQATQVRFDSGLVTEPDLMQGRQVSARADYDLVTAQSAVEIARINLTRSVGLPAGTPLHTKPANFRSLAASLQGPLDQHIRAALRDRPDLLAQVSAVQAAEARLRTARAQRLPTLALDAIALYNRFEPSVSNSAPFDQISQDFQNYGGFLTIQWPIFTGFAEENKVRLAETARQAAQEELHLLREQVISEVWTAYVQAKNALARHEAAAALEAASKSSYQSALASFDRGLTPLQELLVARAAYAQASALLAEADAAIAQAVTAFAFSTGRL